MSEEKIIEKINYMINNWHRSVLEIRIEWIKGLLDLYNKEKEKNKLLIESKFREVADKNSYIQDNYISKDKIREKIKELKQNCEGTEDCQIIDIIEILQELLEERN